MISILPSFSRRVVRGVLRRKKSSTKIAFKAHNGRLRSVLFVHDNDHITNQIAPTKQPSPVEEKQNALRTIENLNHQQGSYQFPLWANEPPRAGPAPPPSAQELQGISGFQETKAEKRDIQCHYTAEHATLAKCDQIWQHNLHRRSNRPSSQPLYSYSTAIWTGTSRPGNYKTNLFQQ